MSNSIGVEDWRPAVGGNRYVVSVEIPKYYPLFFRDVEVDRAKQELFRGLMISIVVGRDYTLRIEEGWRPAGDDSEYYDVTAVLEPLREVSK